MEKINVNIPEGWGVLTQEQLKYLLSTMATVQSATADNTYLSQEDYVAQTTAQIATYCFFNWAALRYVCPYSDGVLVEHDDGTHVTRFVITTEQLTSAVASLDWITSIPDYPVRFDVVDGCTAVAADLSEGFSFDKWLACETLWQSYQTKQSDETLRQMAAILYDKDDIVLEPFEVLNIFYWWAAVKNMVNSAFPNLFQNIDNEAAHETPSLAEMRRTVDVQIRALTKGDITKEATVLSMEAMRALTELDAQAREYEELNRKYPAK